MTPRRRKGDAEDPEPSFADLMAEEAAGGAKTERAKRSAVPPIPARPKRKVAPKASALIVFVRPDEGEVLLGHVPGMQRRILRQLRSGRPAPQEDIDLHGLTAREAKVELRSALAEAAARHLRCVRVIHGRGLRSSAERGPVLKRLLADWLSDPSVGSGVLAFAPAPPGEGGSGATLLLLRGR